MDNQNETFQLKVTNEDGDLIFEMELLEELIYQKDWPLHFHKKLTDSITGYFERMGEE